MISKQSLLVHLGLFIVASGLGLRAITKQEVAEQEKHETELWSVAPESITRIEFESKRRKLVLQSEKDAQGRYFVGTVDKEKSKPPQNPHAPKEAADAGAPPPSEPAVVERQTVRFIATTDANELAESLAKLRAKRSLGKLDPGRFEEFGFDQETSGTLRLDISGSPREFVLGGKTPGGSDVYLRDAKSGEGYVVQGSLARDLETAEASLIARTPTSFEPSEVVRVVLKSGEAQRELVPVPEQKDFWANPSDPQNKDETASNWMTKFGRLRVNEYVEKPEGELTPIATVEYFGKDGKSLGLVELASQAQPGADKPTYLVRSRETRWYGSVVASSAEQLAEDVQSVLTP